MPMRINYVMIDYESVQPESLADLAREQFRVIVFVGSNQPKLQTDFVIAMQAMGASARYVQISGSGKNALDFHIAFYIGQFAEHDSTAYFHIISKDGGFDPLIQHLKSRNIFAARWSSVEDIPLLKGCNKKSHEDRARSYIEYLIQPKVARPKKLGTLTNAVAAFFAKELTDDDVAGVISSMQKVGFLSIVDGKVSYVAAS